MFLLAMGHAIGDIGPAVRAGAASREAGSLRRALVVVGVVFVLQQTIVPVTDVVADRLGLRVRGEVFRRTVAASLRPATIAHLEEPALRDLVARATAPGQYGPRSATRGLVMQWSTRLGGVSALVILATWHWWAGLLLALVLVHSVRRMQGAHLDLVKSQVRQTQTLRRSDYFRDLLLQPEAAKETRVFGLGPWLTGRFVHEWGVAMTTVWAQRRGTARDAAIGVVPILAVVTVIGSRAATEMTAGAIGPGRLVVVLQCCVTSFAVATINIWDSWVELGLSSVKSMRKLEREVDAPALALGGHVSPEGMPAQAIRFEGVRFAYGNGRPVFEGLDLEIAAGRSLAIVGENGAGKTTLVKLLARLYDPTDGRITVDGVDLHEIDAHAWQRRTAAVFQDFVRYPWTAAENVALDANVDHELLERVARDAGATEVIVELPNG